MQNINVSRYENSKQWLAAITPDDRSWCLFIDVDGVPSLYREKDIKAADGVTERTLINVEQVADTWTFEGYWTTVFGASCTAELAVKQFRFEDIQAIREWIARCELGALAARRIDRPAEWDAHADRALGKLAVVEKTSQGPGQA